MKPIPDLPGYFADKEGNIYGNLKRNFNKNSNRLMKLKPILVGGYAVLSIHKNCIKKQMKVHRLIALTFLKKDLNKKYVNHKNLIKHDNRVENLEWVTSKENTLHARRNKYWGLGSDHHSSKLTSSGVKLIRKSIKTNAELSRLYKVSPASINKIKLRKSWKHI